MTVKAFEEYRSLEHAFLKKLCTSYKNRVRNNDGSKGVEAATGKEYRQFDAIFTRLKHPGLKPWSPMFLVRFDVQFYLFIRSVTSCVLFTNHQLEPCEALDTLHRRLVYFCLASVIEKYGLERQHGFSLRMVGRNVQCEVDTRGGKRLEWCQNTFIMVDDNVLSMGENAPLASVEARHIFLEDPAADPRAYEWTEPAIMTESIVRGAQSLPFLPRNYPSDEMGERALVEYYDESESFRLWEELGLFDLDVDRMPVIIVWSYWATVAGPLSCQAIQTHIERCKNEAAYDTGLEGAVVLSFGCVDGKGRDLKDTISEGSKVFAERSWYAVEEK